MLRVNKKNEPSTSIAQLRITDPQFLKFSIIYLTAHGDIFRFCRYRRANVSDVLDIRGLAFK